MQLRLENVYKSFGEKKILHDINFTVSSGRAMGFLGRNGAGKTTTIRCIMKVFNPDEGRILLDGKAFHPKEYPIGYLPEERGLYQKEIIKDQLLYLAKLRGTSTQEAKKNIQYWLEKVDLSEYADKKLEVLSKGNQQKIQIIQCFLHNPEIIILDEPFSGLDPINSQVLKNVVREKITEGKLVVFSSHQMTYVEEFCDDITLIDKGEIVLSGDLEEIKRDMAKDKVRITVKDDEQLKALLSEEAISYVMEDKNSFVFALPVSARKEFLQKLLSRNLELESFAPYRPSLNDIFIQKVGEHDA